tara:strand:- start:1162 stop:1425 length:264 start_codon:yes stop_codon:yes gene_type:complete
MMRDTSLDTYRDIKPSLGHREQIVYDTIKTLGCPTDLEIAKYLHFKDPNKVRPRRKGLVDKGAVVECEKRICSISGRTVWSWRINER